jgi:O-antigen ligase
MTNYGAGSLELNSTKHILRRDAGVAISRSFASAPELRWLWIGLFVLAIALLGGSSRPDPMQNALLRPIAALFLIPACYHLRLIDIAHVKMLATLLSLLLAWMALQLVPLPPVLWQGLPGRSVIAQLDQLAGLEGTWRPVSLAPFRGINAIMGMVVPITALLLAVSMKMSQRIILLAIVGIGLIDATFGLLQVIGGPRSPLYLFAITSRGAPAGVFANENHSAVLSALVLLAIARLSIEEGASRDPAWLRFALAPAFTFILLAVLVTGSRAGFAATLATLIAAAAMVLLKKREQAMGIGATHRPPNLHARGGLLLLALAAVLAIVIAGFVWLQRTPALEDILTRSSFEDLRWSLWPVLGTMVGDHWFLGTGFGSFDAVYRLYEPTELLLTRYVNHAHNDWAQLVIEGGLPAALLLIAGLGWLSKTLLIILKQSSDSLLVNLIFWIACIAIMSAASIVDYPLRTPIFQCVAIWLLTSLALERAGLGCRDLVA